MCVLLILDIYGGVHLINIMAYPQISIQWKHLAHPIKGEGEAEDDVVGVFRRLVVVDETRRQTHPEKKNASLVENTLPYTLA
jgi:hypothetical protein